MRIRTLNVHETKKRLSAVLADTEAADESFPVCRHGKPVAKLIPRREPSRLKPHPLMRKIKTKYDPIEPLSRDEWPEAAQ